MSTNTSTQSNAMEFQVNNQLGDPDKLADISEGDEASGTRGLKGTETQERPRNQTPTVVTDADIYAIIQQILKQQEQTLEHLSQLIHKQHVNIGNEVAMQVEQERTNNKKLFQDCQVETNHKIPDNTDKITEISMNTKQQFVGLEERHSNNMQVVSENIEINNKRYEDDTVSENIDRESEETEIVVMSDESESPVMMDVDEGRNSNMDRRGEDETSPLHVTNHDGDEAIELEKDPLTPYWPAIHGCRSAKDFQCLNSMSEEDTANPWEIKPSQTHVRKSRPHSRREKHSSRSRHASSSHRKRHHHSRSHRDEHRRHNRDKVTMKEENSLLSRLEFRSHRNKEALKSRKEEKQKEKEHRNKEALKSHKEEKQKEKERQERELHREGRLELERIIEIYRKEIEVRRQGRQDKERSSSREKKREDFETREKETQNLHTHTETCLLYTSRCV